MVVARGEVPALGGSITKLRAGEARHRNSDARRRRKGIRQMRRGLEDFRSTGARNWLPYYVALLAEALWHAGDYEEALVALRDGKKRRRAPRTAFSGKRR